MRSDERDGSGRTGLAEPVATRGLDHERLAALVSQAPAIVFSADKDGIVNFCRGKALSDAGVDSDEFLGHHYTRWKRITPEMVENMERAFRGESFAATLRFEGRVYSTRFAPLENAAGSNEGVVGVSTDITEQVREEDERREIESRHHQSQHLESLALLAEGMAHDFNDLLTAVMGNTDLALADLPGDSPLRSYLERIRKAALEGAELTDQLLVYSGQGEVQLRPLDVSGLVEESRRRLGSLLGRGAELRCELGRDLPPVAADATQISRVVSNLVANAAEALPEGGGSVIIRTGRAQVGAPGLRACAGLELTAGGYVFLEVEDNGSGIEDAARARMFDPLFTTRFPGRGLGLATVLAIVRAHGGALTVQSENGRGTRLRVLLPPTTSPSSESESAPL